MRPRPNNQGFTLIEVLASAGLVAIGLVAAMSALGSMTHAEALGREREAIANLAIEKYNEVVATTDLTQANSLNGDFTDRNDTDHTWTGSVAPVDTSSSSSVVNTATATSSASVDSLTITVVSSANLTLKSTVTGLVYVPPATIAAPTGATGAAGGAAGATRPTGGATGTTGGRTG